jgi:hypothetical protein
MEEVREAAHHFDGNGAKPGDMNALRHERFKICRQIPVVRLELPVPRKNFPDSLLRECAERSLWNRGFMLRN